MKAEAVVPAIEASDAEIVIVCDADCFSEGVPAAVDAVRNGSPWAVPHGDVYRLTKAGTAALIEGAEWSDQDLEEPAYQGRWGGGIMVGRREVLLDCPLDPRFVGWSREDQAWAMALTYLHGKGWRGSAPLIHLYHPPQERPDRRHGSPATEQLFRRYCKARSGKQQMRTLIEEARCAFDASRTPISP